MNDMKETNETINYYKELYENTKKANSGFYLLVSGYATYEDLMSVSKFKHINLRIDGNLKEKVLKTMEDYYQEKIQECMKKLGELQETLKNL